MSSTAISEGKTCSKKLKVPNVARGKHFPLLQQYEARAKLSSLVQHANEGVLLNLRDPFGLTLAC